MKFTFKKVLIVSAVFTFVGVAVGISIFGKHKAFHFETAEEEAREHNAAPNDWYFDQRVYPYNSIPQTTWVKGVQELKTQRSKLIFRGNAPKWNLIGPTNAGGRVTSVTGTIQDANVFYAGTADGGVWKTDDRGAHFNPIFDDQGTLTIGDVAVDPKDSNVVWVGTGEANPSGDSYSGLGIYVSQDGGGTFKKKGLENVGRISRIVIDPTDSNKIYVAALGDFHVSGQNRGVYRTLDGGNTWTQSLYVHEDAGADELVMDPTNPKILYAAMWEVHRLPLIKKFGGPHSGIYKSEDGGDTWNELKTGLPTPGNDTGRIGLAISASNHNVLYATYDVALKNFEGLYKTTDAGKTWTKSRGSSSLTSINSSYGWWFGHVAVDPKDENTVYVVGFSVAKSTDGGNSFRDWTGNMHPDNHALYIDPHNSRTLLLGNDSGLYMTEDGGAHFTHFNLPISQFYSIAIDPNNPVSVYGGLQDNGTVRTKTGHTDDWEMIYEGCDGFEVQIDPRNSRVIFAECQNGDLGRSDDGADSFVSVAPPFARADWEMPIKLNVVNPNILYAGGESMFMSPDQGNSWKKISPDLSQDVNKVSAITTFDVAESDQNVIYAGTDNGMLWVTQDEGAHWTQINKGLPNRWITRVRTRSNSPSEVYVTVSGFRWSESAAQVFKSIDYGANWTPLVSGLPDAPVNDIILDPNDTNKMYLANDFGVYVSSDAGQNWSPLGVGMPITSVVDLKLDAKNHNLLAATHGRGIYSLVTP